MKKPESSCCLRRCRGDRRIPLGRGSHGSSRQGDGSSHGRRTGHAGRQGDQAQEPWQRGRGGAAAVGGLEGLTRALRPTVDCRRQGQAGPRAAAGAAGQGLTGPSLSESEGWLLGRRRAGEAAAEVLADLPPVRWAKRTPRAGPHEGGNRQNRLHLESRTPPWAGLWILSYMPSIYGNDIPTGKPDPAPQMEEPQGST